MTDALAYRPGYSVTNESIEAVMGGLQVSEKDRILAIAGSGDQGFAMLEITREVVLVDNDERQIDWVRRRARCLAKGDNVDFLYAPHSIDEWAEICKPRRDEYFEIPGRLEKIRANLPGLRVKLDDITIFSQNSKPESFDKIYLSNAGGDTPKPEFFKKFAHALSPGGLLYHADVGFSRGYIPERTGLILERELTKLAISKEMECKKNLFFWKPAVFRKKA